PWWSWLGGLFGAAYLTVAILVAPRLGAATFIACVVAGQMLVSALCDQFGWAGFPVRRLSWEGYLGLALVVAGVLLLQWRGRA
ncbi:EamA-like transporter family protein, partial [Pseudomonas aeruginosa]|nr:EamA-like transporter family protein [Pseudomonas aeruginosa]MBF3156501.1 EamA-like transporter family protein [Pseudomonas aeruginosa]MBW6185321.1 DMT family transporter [Pseudomonas aeruginosa]